MKLLKNKKMGRKNIYYWKCDRPHAFHAIKTTRKFLENKISTEVEELLRDFFSCDDFTILPGAGQGNHLTFLIRKKSEKYFLRIEDGDDDDDYMEVEAFVINEVTKLGVPSPVIFKVDSSRAIYPFAYQIMEYIDSSDLNKIYKKKELNTISIMEEAGKYIASWQKIAPRGFGPFDVHILRNKNILQGIHTRYIDYYRLNLIKHLDFLVNAKFINKEKAEDILDLILEYESLLNLEKGCLVHKDLALWNLMGTNGKIEAVIDWDDTISGDSTDDIALMACFHSANEIKAILKGYELIKPLPEEFINRFWLHLLRNMIFKAVIRVGAGYFDRGEEFFLINMDNTNEKGINTLKEFTLNRINLAIEGLKGLKSLDDL